MADHQPGAQGTGFADRIGNGGGWEVGQLDPGHYRYPPGLPQLSGHPDKARDDQVHVGKVAVIGDAQGPVTGYGGPADQFGGNQFAITEDGMGMQIDHGDPWLKVDKLFWFG
jgi:hypothetical protein